MKFLAEMEMERNAGYACSGFRTSSRRERAAGANSAAATACGYHHPVVHQGKQNMDISRQVWHLDAVLSFRCAIMSAQEMEDMYRIIVSCGLATVRV